jgi:hypothetical protein
MACAMQSVTYPCSWVIGTLIYNSNTKAKAPSKLIQTQLRILITEVIVMAMRDDYGDEDGIRLLAQLEVILDQDPLM